MFVGSRGLNEYNPGCTSLLHLLWHMHKVMEFGVNSESAMCILAHVQRGELPPLQEFVFTQLPLVSQAADLLQAAHCMVSVCAELPITVFKLCRQVGCEVNQPPGLASFAFELRMLLAFDCSQLQSSHGNFAAHFVVFVVVQKPCFQTFHASLPGVPSSLAIFASQMRQHRPPHRTYDVTQDSTVDGLVCQTWLAQETMNQR